jgi:peroxiredoxin
MAAEADHHCVDPYVGRGQIFLRDILAALRRSLLTETGGQRAAYDEFLERLDSAKVAGQALKAGDAMPRFLLPNAEGQLIDSADLLATGPLVVTFFRGDWCPYCSATLDAMEAVLAELTEAAGTLVAMTPETGGRTLATKRAHKLHYEVLADVDLAIAMAFGIVFRTPPLYEELLRRRGIDIAERSGNPAWLLPIPAMFLVGRDDIIARTWINIDFTQRAEPREVLDALKLL